MGESAEHPGSGIEVAHLEITAIYMNTYDRKVKLNLLILTPRK